LTWQDLENKINKWNTDIEQQVSVFIKQATQVNAWSSLLLSNGEKISDLCNQLESVKVEQDELDQELDRVNAQQVELEAILKPLEDAASKNRSSSQQHVDNERERTYNLAGSVDAQIKLLAQDLREVIERINSQQGNGGNNQLESITSILSSHTDALQWVEEQSSTLQRRLDQVTKAVDTRASMEQRNF
jgi:nuclear pore complex protein Nup62